MARRYDVIVAPRATRQLDRIVEWWSVNRPQAPDLFVDEFAAALVRLSANPGAGVPYRIGPRPDVRRLLLPRTRYHVYYATAEAVRRVAVLAVWHSRRGGKPVL